MRTLDRIFGIASLVGFAAFLSVIVFKVMGRPPVVMASAGTPRVNADWPWLENFIAPLRPFFIIFNEYMLIVVMGFVVILAAIDFWLSLRPGGDTHR